VKYLRVVRTTRDGDIGHAVVEQVLLAREKDLVDRPALRSIQLGVLVDL
jgi:hypothetical protein